MTYELVLEDVEIELTDGDTWTVDYEDGVHRQYIAMPRLTLEIDESRVLIIDGVDCTPQNVRDWVEHARQLQQQISYLYDHLEARKEHAERATRAADVADELREEISRLKRGYGKELNDTEAELATALGYEHHPLYGWVVGDHTTVTLAMEARQTIDALLIESDLREQRGKCLDRELADLRARVRRIVNSSTRLAIAPGKRALLLSAIKGD